jgi:predicted nucleotide-binding protein
MAEANRSVRLLREVEENEHERSERGTVDAAQAMEEEEILAGRSVFIISGRDESARVGLLRFLRAVGLRPLEWDEVVRYTGEASPYISGVLEAAFTKAQAVIVLLTPDEFVFMPSRMNDPSSRLQAQPPANVLFEAGMAMGRHPSRTIFVEFGETRMPSDLQGHEILRFDERADSRYRLGMRLIQAGCAIDMSGTAWLEA